MKKYNKNFNVKVEILNVLYLYYIIMTNEEILAKANTKDGLKKNGGVYYRVYTPMKNCQIEI